MNFEIPGFNNSKYQLSIEHGDVLVFIGANGTGKTRLGFYLEERKFALTSSGIEQKNIQLSNERQELETKTRLVNSISIQLANIERLSDEEFLSQCIDYQQQRKILNDRSVFTQIEIIDMFFSGQINAENVTFRSNEFIGNTIPPRSLDDIRGGEIIIGDLHFEVDLLKARASDSESISIARRYTLGKLDAQLKALVS